MKIKATFILKNGQKVIIKCKGFEITKLSNKENRSLSIDKADRIWSIDIDEIVAVTAKKVLF